MNANQIVTNQWSNPATEKMYKSHWSDEPELFLLCEDGNQCGGCSFFAEFNSDWGLCCHSKSRHHLETVFEHFNCPSYVKECWGPHSFTEETEFHCRCEGSGSEYWDNLVRVLQQIEQPPTDG